MPVIRKSLQKAVSEGNQRFWVQINDWAAIWALRAVLLHSFEGQTGNLHLKIIIQCVIDETSTTCSWRSFLNYKSSVPSFSGSMVFSISIIAASSKKKWSENISSLSSIYVQLAQWLTLNQVSLCHQLWGLWFISCWSGAGATVCWNSLHLLAILSSSEPVCGLTSRLLYHYTLHNDFSQN